MSSKSLPPQQDAVAEAWTADFLVFRQALYHWAMLPPCICMAPEEKYLKSPAMDHSVF